MKVLERNSFYNKNELKNESAADNMRIALIGNPNCGKTTLFNSLTGSRQYVGNWPGVTVEKKEGNLKFKNTDITVIDLPGIYSLSPYSSEEIITRNCLMQDNVDLIVNIVDSSNMERNLYLTTQIAELGKPMIIALNMIDIIEKRGDKIDYIQLSKRLGFPVIPISANKHIGVNELLDYIIRYNNYEKSIQVNKIFSSEIERVLNKIEHTLGKNKKYTRWLSIKLFEDDIIISKQLNDTDKSKIDGYKRLTVLPPEFDRQMLIADERYKYICNLCAKCLIKNKKLTSFNLTDKIDSIVTNKFLAIPVFLTIMGLIFYITFGPLGNYLRDTFDFFIKEIFANFILNALSSFGAAEWAKSLIVGGIIEGVGSVVSFLPQIALLFTLLSILEDSGYMARAAFITDKLLRKVGLSGRAFVPLLMGFGCSVPAVLGTRILEKSKDRRLTILIIPFMSCSAKMPVYAIFISAFFHDHQALIIFSIYILGIVMGIFTAFLFKSTLLKGKEAPFIMELPEYRLPTAKNLFLHVGERVRDFLAKAGTVLVFATIVIWFLQSFNMSLQMVESKNESILAGIGNAIAPIFGPCGFGDWKSSVSLLSGLIAKESVVSTMAVLYDCNGTVDLVGSIFSHFNIISAYAFMAFVLLYTPCVAAISTMIKEFKSVKWACFSIIYQLLIAWLSSACIFQIGTLISKFISM